MPATTSTRRASMTPAASTRRATTSTCHRPRTPHLTIVKDATEANYDSVGDVIHYTIVATNTGNTTLAAVTVTDPNATGLTCVPANGSPLAPGAHLDCTATHTVTQADIDAGHYLNTACVDDGARRRGPGLRRRGHAVGQEPAPRPSSRTPPKRYDASETSSTTRSSRPTTGNSTLAQGDRHRSERAQPDLHAGQRLTDSPPARRSTARPTTRSPRPTSMPAITSTPPASTTARAGAPQACDDANVPATSNPAPRHRQGRRPNRATTASVTSSTTRSSRPTTATRRSPR